jgi:ABC-type nitrate/sulfonate/bicarbonate transport system substrate-binding protein
MLVNARTWLSGKGQGSGTRVRLSAAHDEWNHVGIALAGIDQGFFAEEGITDIELITFPGEVEALLDREATQVGLIADGAVDIGIDPRTTFVLEAKDQGRPACIVAARRKNHAFVLFGQKGMSSIDELKGMTMITGHRGGANDTMIRQVLQDSGLVPDEDVEIEYTGGPMHSGGETVRRFREGKQGPAILASTAEVPALTAEGFPILADLRVLYPSRHDRVTAANERFVVEHPDLLEAFLRGMIRSCRYVLDPANGPVFKDIMLRAGFLNTESQRQEFDGLFAGWQTRGTRDLSLPREGIELIVDEAQRAGRISPSFRVDDVLRLDALGKAQAALAE